MEISRQQVADNLLRELSDRGQIVEGGWKAYEFLSGLKECPEVQRIECRKAFFFGAQHLFAGLMGMLEPGKEATDMDLERITKLEVELIKFLEDIKKMNVKTWPYGSTRKGVVQIANWRPKGLAAEAAAGQLIVDEHGEGHVCIGPDCADFSAKNGDKGTLTFTEGGPTGGYWKFTKDQK